MAPSSATVPPPGPAPPPRPGGRNAARRGRGSHPHQCGHRMRRLHAHGLGTHHLQPRCGTETFRHAAQAGIEQRALFRPRHPPRGPAPRPRFSRKYREISGSSTVRSLKFSRPAPPGSAAPLAVPPCHRIHRRGKAGVEQNADAQAGHAILDAGAENRAFPRAG